MVSLPGRNGRLSTDDTKSFGNIAVELGLITTEELEGALAEQEKAMPIGEILVKRGLITETQRKLICLEQEARNAKTPSARSEVNAKIQQLSIRGVSDNLLGMAHELRLFAADIIPKNGE